MPTTLLVRCGYSDCNGNINDGCEIYMPGNVSHCGGCNMVCPVRPNSAPTCNNGQCSFVCNPGYADCNNNATDGCEVNETCGPNPN